MSSRPRSDQRDSQLRRSARRRHNGAWAEALASDYLLALGWRVLGRNVHIGRDEVDILALDPAGGGALVVVEVRGLHAQRFGAPEERVDRGKVGRLYRAAAALRAAGRMASGEPMPRLPWRVDLVVVDMRTGDPDVRHLRAIEPP